MLGPLVQDEAAAVLRFRGPVLDRDPLRGAIGPYPFGLPVRHQRAEHHEVLPAARLQRRHHRPEDAEVCQEDSHAQVPGRRDGGTASILGVPEDAVVITL